MSGVTSEPVSVPPDEKDWTWVLERPCDACGFDSSKLRRDWLASDVRRYAIGYNLIFPQMMHKLFSSIVSDRLEDYARDRQLCLRRIVDRHRILPFLQHHGTLL